MLNYHKIFIRNEYHTIRGKRNGNFWILFLVFFLSLGALSISRSGLAFLQQKMEDPFINWINIHDEPELDNFFKQLSSYEGDSLLQHFNIKSIEKNNFLVEFVKGNRRIIGRTLDANSQLWNKILESSNVHNGIIRSTPLNEQDFGWVVTADFLSNLGYFDTNTPLFLALEYRTTFSTHFVPIPLVAVVERLPDDIDFVTTNYFYEQLRDLNHPFYIGDSAQYFHNLNFVVEDVDEAKPALEKELAGIDLEWETEQDYDKAYLNATLLSAILYDGSLTMHQLDSICQNIEAAYSGIYRYYDYQFGSGYSLQPDYVSIMFQDLEKVSEFQKWAKSNYNIRIDMAQIEAKENFNRFNNLATWLCIAIIVMSALFMIIFLYFLISAHFQKISKNLGTIMAFGMSSTTIMLIYLRVFIRLVAGGLLTAWLVLLCGQFVFELLHLGYPLNGQTLPYFQPLDAYVCAFIGGILCLSVMVTLLLMNKKTQSTPGDLIYERNN